LDTQVGHGRERQERDRRIDALSVGVLIAIGEREAAERRASELLQTMFYREQLSLRPAVPWLGDTISLRSASQLLGLARPDQSGCDSCARRAR
jgi:hypothetical protein